MATGPIPIVDCGSLVSSDNTETWHSVVNQIDSALSSIGFVYLTNHGIPNETIENAFNKSKCFFDLSTETKMKFKKRFGPGHHLPADYNGYATPGDETFEQFDERQTMELRESFDIVGPRPYPVCPSDDQVPGFQDAMYNLKKELSQLSIKFLKLFAIAMELDDVNFFVDRAKNITDEVTPALNDLRILSYPPTVPMEKFIRCAAHTDYGFCTFLAQDSVGGLEVQTVDGKWIPAPGIPHTILLNTGDLLQFWSDGHYPGTPHRVQLSDPDPITGMVPGRQSIAFFITADDSVMVSPLKSKFSEGKPEQVVNSKDYVLDRARVAYKIT